MQPVLEETSNSNKQAAGIFVWEMNWFSLDLLISPLNHHFRLIWKMMICCIVMENLRTFPHTVRLSTAKTYEGIMTQILYNQQHKSPSLHRNVLWGKKILCSICSVWTPNVTLDVGYSCWPHLLTWGDTLYRTHTNLDLLSCTTSYTHINATPRNILPPEEIRLLQTQLM